MSRKVLRSQALWVCGVSGLPCLSSCARRAEVQQISLKQGRSVTVSALEQAGVFTGLHSCTMW